MIIKFYLSIENPPFLVLLDIDENKSLDYYIQQVLDCKEYKKLIGEKVIKNHKDEILLFHSNDYLESSIVDVNKQLSKVVVYTDLLVKSNRNKLLKPNGVYVNGPIGHGKTNSIYEIVNELRKNEKNRVFYIGDCYKWSISRNPFKYLANCLKYSLSISPPDNNSFINNFWLDYIPSNLTINLFFDLLITYCKNNSLSFYIFIDEYNKILNEKVKESPFNIINILESKFKQVELNECVLIVSASLGNEFSFNNDNFELFKFQNCFTNNELKEWIKMKDYSRFGISNDELFEKIQFATSSIPFELSILDNEIKFKGILDNLKPFDKIIQVYSSNRSRSIMKGVSDYLDTLSQDKKKQFKNGISLMKLDLPFNQLPLDVSLQQEIMYFDNKNHIKAIGRLYYNILLGVVSRLGQNDTEFTNYIKDL